jgi:hypothetical protein
LFLLTLASVSACVVALLWIGGSPKSPVADIASASGALAVGVVTGFLVGTCRIVGDPNGYVEVINLFATRRVPVDLIVHVTATRGMRIVLASNREIGSLAYGESLLGHSLGYPRSTRAANRIQAFVDSMRAVSSARADDVRPVETRLRVGALASALALGLLLILATVLINRA